MSIIDHAGALQLDPFTGVSRPADHLLGRPQGQKTVEDYEATPDDGNRYDLIEGLMWVSPQPLTGHQAASMWLSYHLVQAVQVTGLGRVFAAPFYVRLAESTVVEPDICVLLAANVSRLTRRGLEGPPDLVVEIASRSTRAYDRRQKQDAYARAGVPELWFPDPDTQSVEVLQLVEGAYRSIGVFCGEQRIPAGVLPELPVTVAQYFA